MKKGLVSFIIILCMLIPFTVGCQSNSADTVTPTQMQNQTALALYINVKMGITE